MKSLIKILLSLVELEDVEFVDMKLVDFVFFCIIFID